MEVSEGEGCMITNESPKRILTIPEVAAELRLSTHTVRGKQPKLSPKQQAHLVDLYRAGGHTSAELAELFGVARSTVYRAVVRGQLVAG